MTRTSLAKYTQRCDMNIQYAVLKRSFPKLFPARPRSQYWMLFTKGSETGEEKDGEEWVGLIRSIKQNFRTQINKTSRKLEKKIDAVSERINQLTEKMNN